MRLSANEEKIFCHMQESRYQMKTHKQSLVIWICIFIGYLDSCMNLDTVNAFLDSCMP